MQKSADSAATPVETDLQRHATQDLSRTLREIGEYRVTRQLGAGAYGTVYLASAGDNRSMERQVAIKVLSRGDEQSFERLLQEAKIIGQFDKNVGIVQLIDVEPHGQLPYYVMPYFERGSLARRMGESPLSVNESLALFRALVSALGDVHGKGIFHCDLKPQNILLDDAGRPFIADFGQARLPGDNAPALGTWFYMPPDQADHTAVGADSRWDVYALGAMLYELLTGSKPRWSPGLVSQISNATVKTSLRLEIYRKALAEAPTPTEHYRVPGVDKPLARLIDRCLSLDPAERPAGARDVQAALAAADTERQNRRVMLWGLALPALAMIAILAATAAMMANRLAGQRDRVVAVANGDAERIAVRLQQRLEAARGFLQDLTERHTPAEWAELLAADRTTIDAELQAWHDEAPLRFAYLDDQGPSTMANRADAHDAIRAITLFDANGVMLGTSLASTNDPVGGVYTFRDYVSGLEVPALKQRPPVAVDDVLDAPRIVAAFVSPSPALQGHLSKLLPADDQVWLASLNSSQVSSPETRERLAALLSRLLAREEFLAFDQANPAEVWGTVLESLPGGMSEYVAARRWQNVNQTTRDDLREEVARLLLAAYLRGDDSTPALRSRPIVQSAVAAEPFESSRDGAAIFAVSIPLPPLPGAHSRAASGLLSINFELKDLGAWMKERPESQAQLRTHDDRPLYPPATAKVEAVTGDTLPGHKDFAPLSAAAARWKVDVMMDWNEPKVFRQTLLWGGAVGLLLLVLQSYMLRRAILPK